MSRKDWALLVLAAAGGHALSPAQLQKSLFLLGRALPKEAIADFYSFSPYHYGPFDVNVYSDAEQMKAEGFVEINRSAGRKWVEYAATPEGLARAAELRPLAPRQSLEYLTNVVAWVRTVSFSELVRAIYAQFPEFRVNSVFQG